MNTFNPGTLSIFFLGGDRTVRIWNYDTGNVEMIDKYETNVETVALHPTGLFAAIGFSDQLRLMQVSFNEFKVCYLQVPVLK